MTIRRSLSRCFRKCNLCLTAHQKTALVRAYQCDHGADGPATRGLHQTVEDHERHEHGVGAAGCENEIAENRKAKSAKQQHPRPPFTPYVPVYELPNHVGKQIRRPHVGDVVQAPMELIVERRFYKTIHFAAEVIARVAEIGRNENPPPPGNLLSGQCRSQFASPRKEGKHPEGV